MQGSIERQIGGRRQEYQERKATADPWWFPAPCELVKPHAEFYAQALKLLPEMQQSTFGRVSGHVTLGIDTATTQQRNRWKRGEE